MNREHKYKTLVTWTGNRGIGTRTYAGYDRSYTIGGEFKPTIEGSSDPSFRGDKTKYNPEEFFLASLSTCHMLCYLHLCADAGIVVTDYRDQAKAVMVENADGSGRFVEVVLQPCVTITDAKKTKKANDLHHEANKMCFIANSCNFQVKHNPTCKIAS
jgi:organic hydroperoxide reductase OsmC/OhrA